MRKHKVVLKYHGTMQSVWDQKDNIHAVSEHDDSEVSLSLIGLWM